MYNRGMRLPLAALVFLCGCHGAESKPAIAPVELPKNDPPRAVVQRHVEPGRTSFTMLVDFSILRTHPAAAQLAILIPQLPVWKQSLASSRLDVMRDCDWMSIEGTNVRDATDDVVLVHYHASDSDVESAVLSLVSQRVGMSTGTPVLDIAPDVRSWQMEQRGEVRVFLRPQNDHLLAVLPYDKAVPLAHTLSRSKIEMPAHGDHAVDIRATNPHEIISMMPAAFVEERIWISPVGSGAKLRVEGDCKDEASAKDAATELEDGVRKRNSLGVKMVTHGAFNGFHAEAKGTLVYAEQTFSAEQIDAVLRMTALAEGARLP